MSSEPPQEITFRIGKRKPVALSRIEANEILGRAVERTVQATALSRMIESALETGEEVVFVAGMDMEQDELMLCLEAIDAEHPLSASYAALLEIAKRPITGTDP